MKWTLLIAATLATPAAAQVYVDNNQSAKPQTVCSVNADGTCTPIGSNLPMPTRAIGVGSIATAQVSVGTTATLVVAARAGRQRVIMSEASANQCAFGNAGVTTGTGFALQAVAGATITLDTSAAVYAVCSATTTINVLEQF